MLNIDTAVQALVDADVEFVVIGGWSAIINGSRFMTDDLDICFARKPDNLRRLAQALKPYHPRLRGLPKELPFTWDEATLRNGTVFTLVTDLGDIDLLGEVSGLGSFDEVRAGSRVVQAFGRTVRALDLKSLIKAKRAAGRDKDLAVLPELESLLEAQET
jgi:predicted nucleotidyltransferase